MDSPEGPKKSCPQAVSSPPPHPTMPQKESDSNSNLLIRLPRSEKSNGVSLLPLQMESFVLLSSSFSSLSRGVTLWVFSFFFFSSPPFFLGERVLMTQIELEVGGIGRRRKREGSFCLEGGIVEGEQGILLNLGRPPSFNPFLPSYKLLEELCVKLLKNILEKKNNFQIVFFTQNSHPTRQPLH